MKKNQESKVQNLVTTKVAEQLKEVKEVKTSKAQKTKGTTSKKELVPITKKETPKVESKKEIKTKKTKVVKEVAKQQSKSIIEKVISNREVKYIYPEDIQDTLARKKWRQQVRNELHRLEREMYRIKDQNSKEFKEASKKYEGYKSKVLKLDQVA
jgi:hypothetical protein